MLARRLSLAALAILACFGAPRSARAEAPMLAPEARVPGVALVKLAGLPPEHPDASRVLARIAADTKVGLELVRPSILGWGIYALEDLDPASKDGLDELRTLALVKRLARHPLVAGASDERRYRALKTPSDPGWQYMWGLEDINAPAAWDITVGLSSQRIGVVDTGTLRGHEDLAAKDVAGYDFISDGQTAGDGNGRDAEYNDEGDGGNCGGGQTPDSWHGSHVAGTILAATENGSGIPGINWQAGLVTARALGKCGGDLSDIMEGAAWLAGASINGVPDLAASDRVSVMNLSLGGSGGCSSYEQDVIDFINGQGVIFVAAAGNDGGAVNSPASCSGVITVAAHGPSGNLTGYSSFGTSVEVVAPGGEILSNNQQGILSAVGPGNSEYSFYEGTSMAAPHVTGAISLLQSVNPGLTRTEISTLFNDYGTDCGGCQGKKRLNLGAIVAAISGGNPVTTPDPEPQPDPTPVNDDVYEENDSWAEAPTLGCNASYELFAATGDLDWFQLELPIGASLNATVDGGSQDLDLYVTNGPTNDNVLGESATPTGQESVTLSNLGGTIGIVVAPWETATGAYTLALSCGGVDIPDPDPAPTDPAPTDPEPDEDPAPDDGTGDEPADVETSDDVEDDVGGTGMNRGLDVKGGCASANPDESAPFAAFALLLLARRRRPRRG